MAVNASELGLSPENFSKSEAKNANPERTQPLTVEQITQFNATIPENERVNPAKTARLSEAYTSLKDRFFGRPGSSSEPNLNQHTQAIAEEHATAVGNSAVDIKDYDNLSKFAKWQLEEQEKKKMTPEQLQVVQEIESVAKKAGTAAKTVEFFTTLMKEKPESVVGLSSLALTALNAYLGDPTYGEAINMSLMAVGGAAYGFGKGENMKAKMGNAVAYSMMFTGLGMGTGAVAESGIMPPEHQGVVGTVTNGFDDALSLAPMIGGAIAKGVSKIKK